MNTKTKKKLIKLVRIVLIIVAMLNILGVWFNNAYAISLVDQDGSLGNVSADAILVGISIMTAGIPLILLNVLKLVIVIIGLIGQVIMSGIYSGLENSFEFVGIEDILFSGTKMGSQFLDVNFFDLSIEGAALTFRTAIAKWYYILRLISTAVLLVILIYVGIRMALSTIAEEQAKYKKMLIDWVTSMALLFVLHYIIIFIININQTFVNALAGIEITSVSDSLGISGYLLDSIATVIWAIGFEGFFMAIIYVLMVGMIGQFFLLYLKRMITVGFLIMISPLITITYSIDKMGDGKSQALNAWFKEFSYNVLIQPFHCIIYLAFFDAIGEMILGNSFGIVPYIFAIVIMKFMKQAEQILRKIFHFQADSMSSIGESGQNFANASGKFMKWGATAGNAFSTFKAAGGLNKAKMLGKDYRQNRTATKQLKSEYKTNKNLKNNMTFSEYKNSSEGQTRMSEIVKTNAENEKTKVEKRKTRKTEKINAKVKSKAAQQLRSEMGDEGYEELKARADSGDENAKSIIANKEKNVKENMPKRKINNFATKTMNNMRTYAESEHGKLTIAGIKDTTKVASAIALGGMALGATGEMNDAISMGQLGYGLADGILKNSTKTLVNDEADVVEKYVNIMNANPQDIQKIITGAVLDKTTGAFDKLPDAEKDLINEISKLMGGNTSKIKDLIKEFKYDANTPGSEIDLEGYVKSLGLDNEADEKKALENIRGYVNKYLLNTIATKAINQENITKLDTDTFASRTQEKVINVIEYKNKKGKVDVNVNVNQEHVNVNVDNEGETQRRTVDNPNSNRNTQTNTQDSNENK